MTETHTGKQSRNGKKPVEVVKGVQISINGDEIKAKGPKGELSQTLRPEVVVTQAEGVLTVRPAPRTGKTGLQYQGLTRAILRNMVEGVANGYKRSLDFRGVGYRAEFKNDQLKMTVGLSHQPIIDIPKAVAVKVETIDEAGTKFPRVHLESPDKQLVGRIAARIRQMRPPEPYNGKGVRYTGERIREKAGKAGKAGGSIMQQKVTGRARRKLRIRKKVQGTSVRPRLAVFRSAKHIYAQVIDDTHGTTIAHASSVASSGDGNKVDVAKSVGSAVAKACIDKGVEQVVFDRGGYRYHGRVRALAESAREAGLKF